MNDCICLTHDAPLLYAVKNCRVACIKQLIKKKNVNIQNEFGHTALMIASHENRVCCVKLLLSAGADVNMKDDLKRTALMHASLFGKRLCNGACIKELLKTSRSNINDQDCSGYTALMFASDMNRPWCVRILILAGADANIQNDDGETVWDLKRQHFIHKTFFRDATDDVPYMLAISSTKQANDVNHLISLADQTDQLYIKHRMSRIKKDLADEQCKQITNTLLSSNTLPFPIAGGHVILWETIAEFATGFC